MAEGRTDTCGNEDLLGRYIECAEYMVQQCRELGNITGASRLEKKCIAELKYLRSLRRRKGGFNINHLRSSNMGHYAGILHAATELPNVTHILQPFSCPGREEPLHVDVVAGQGHFWVKVIARKAQALHLNWAGEGQYGEKNIVQQAEDYRVCSEVHPINFKDPKLVFAFYNAVTAPLAKQLEAIGVLICGDRVFVDNSVEQKLEALNLDDSDFDSESEQKGTFSLARTADKGSKIGNKQQRLKAEVASSLSETEFSRPSAYKSERMSKSVTPSFSSKEEFWELVDPASASKMGKSQSLVGYQCESTFLPDQYFKIRFQLSPLHKPINKNDTQTENASLSCLEFGVSEPKGNNQISGRRFPDALSFLGFNQEMPATDCMSNTRLISPKQTSPESDLQKHRVTDRICHSKKETLIRSRVHSFVAKELLISPNVDYTRLQAVVSANEINVIDKIGRVNLDITTLITLVSAVSHGGCHFRFQEKVLSEQATEERLDPVLPKLQSFLQGKDLFSCETAVKNFRSILDTLGGKQEKKRAAELLADVTVVPDNPSFRAEALPCTGKIKDRSKIIFGTGDSLKAVTVTANSGFVRAAEHQGATFAVFLHASRALTEQKEKTAKILFETDIGV